MKNTKSKTPIDVLRSVDAALRAARAMTEALEGIDPAAFPDAELLEATQRLASQAVLNIHCLWATRPLTKTERARLAAAEAEASSESTPPGVVEAQLEAA